MRYIYSDYLKMPTNLQLNHLFKNKNEANGFMMFCWQKQITRLYLIISVVSMQAMTICQFIGRKL